MSSYILLSSENKETLRDNSNAARRRYFMLDKTAYQLNCILCTTGDHRLNHWILRIIEFCQSKLFFYIDILYNVLTTAALIAIVNSQSGLNTDNKNVTLLDGVWLWPGIVLCLIDLPYISIVLYFRYIAGDLINISLIAKTSLDLGDSTNRFFKYKKSEQLSLEVVDENFWAKVISKGDVELDIMLYNKDWLINIWWSLLEFLIFHQKTILIINLFTQSVMICVIIGLFPLYFLILINIKEYFQGIR